MSELRFRFWRRPDKPQGSLSRCRAAVKSLDLPPNAGMDLVCGRVGTALGRPIRTQPFAFGGVTSGMTVFHGDTYVILRERYTSAWHQQQITAHELGHLLMRHEADGSTAREALQVFVPSLDVDTVMRHMGIGPSFARHSAYSKDAEWEAEYIGTLLVERISPGLGEDDALDAEESEIAALIGPALQLLRTSGRAPGKADPRA